MFLTDMLRSTELYPPRILFGRRHIVGQSSFHRPGVGQWASLRRAVGDLVPASPFTAELLAE
jgi:hypothetical protein